MECVTLIADIKSNNDNSESAFTTKLARPLLLPGQWRASIMDIFYPFQWSNFYQEMTYAVLMVVSHNLTPEYGSRDILDPDQPLAVGLPSCIQTVKKKGLSEKETELYYDANDINFRNKAAKYEIVTGTIEEGKHSDPIAIVNQIQSTVEMMYRIQHPEAEESEFKNIVTFDPSSRTARFRHLKYSRYLIVSSGNVPLISMLGYGTRATSITATSKRVIEVLPVNIVDTVRSKDARRNPLPPREKVNLRTPDCVFVYSDIVEQSLIGESQGNILGYFPIKAKYGDAGYWCFNPPYDYKVIKQCIDTISIKLTGVNGKLFPFKNGQIIIRLRFERMQ